MTPSKRERDELRRRFISGNGVPVERAHFTKSEGLALLDAADEAWALRHNYDYQRERADALADERDRLRAENERLREGVRKLADKMGATVNGRSMSESEIRGLLYSIASYKVNDTADQTAGGE